VALTYRPGILAGTIGAQFVEVREPDGPGLWHQRRTGTVAADGFDVAWTKTQTSEGITNGVRLAGTFAGARVDLDALLHPNQAGSFGHGSVHGSLVDQLLKVTIQAVQGGLGTGRGVKLTGTLGEVAVELFVDLSPERRLGAVIRGTVNNNPVHIDITRRRESDPLTIVGAYQGPTSLLVVLLGILTAFWH
jgi:hypothetical protein